MMERNNAEILIPVANDLVQVFVKVKPLSLSSGAFDLLQVLNGFQGRGYNFQMPNGVFIPMRNNRRQYGEAYLMYMMHLREVFGFFEELQSKLVHHALQVRLSNINEVYCAMWGTECQPAQAIPPSPAPPHCEGKVEIPPSQERAESQIACQQQPPSARERQPLNPDLENPFRNCTLVKYDPPLPYERFKKRWVLLQGIPYQAKLDDIIDFMQLFRKQFRKKSIILFVNDKGVFNGRASIPMKTDSAATCARHKLKRKDMTCEGKTRYVEIYVGNYDEAMHIGSRATTGYPVFGWSYYHPAGFPNGLPVKNDDHNGGDDAAGVSGEAAAAAFGDGAAGASGSDYANAIGVADTAGTF